MVFQILILFSLYRFGITSAEIEKSLKLGFIFFLSMLIVTFSTSYLINVTADSNFPLGVLGFIESFTEEFFFM